jgi:hypothetical protein
LWRLGGDALQIIERDSLAEIAFALENRRKPSRSAANVALCGVDSLLSGRAEIERPCVYSGFGERIFDGSHTLPPLRKCAPGMHHMGINAQLAERARSHYACGFQGMPGDRFRGKVRARQSFPGHRLTPGRARAVAMDHWASTTSWRPYSLIGARPAYLS